MKLSFSSEDTDIKVEDGKLVGRLPDEYYSGKAKIDLEAPVFRNITSLEGFPPKIERLVITDNLVTLENSGIEECDIITFEHGSAESGHMKNLKGFPKKVSFLYAIDTSLTSLEGIPEDCELSQMTLTGSKNITSLKGCPSKLDGLNVIQTGITDLEFRTKAVRY